MARKKIALVGAGQIGGTMALVLAQKNLGDVVLIDIPMTQGMPKGKALDIMEGRSVINSSVDLQGSTDYSATTDLIITLNLKILATKNSRLLVAITFGLVNSAMMVLQMSL